MPKGYVRAKLRLIRPLPNLASLFLVAFGVAILAWVSWLTWSDITWWGKDIAIVLFGSRKGEAISLGIGMRVIHYLLIGLALLPAGLAIFLRRRIARAPMRTPKTSEDVVLRIPKAMVDDIRKREWFKYYHDIGDFIINAIKKSMENWEKVERSKQ